MKYLKAAFSRLNSLIHCVFTKIIYPKQFFFCKEEIIANSTHFTINGKGCIRIGKKCGMRRDCEISVAENGSLTLGDGFFMNRGCVIACHDSITIGNNTRLGPNVMIYDHDYDFKNQDVAQRKKHKTSPVVIGNNVWLGAGVIVLRGTVIGDNCVVGAGSVIKGVYEPNMVITQPRNEDIKEIMYQL